LLGVADSPDSPIASTAVTTKLSRKIGAFTDRSPVRRLRKKSSRLVYIVTPSRGPNRSSSGSGRKLSVASAVARLQTLNVAD
jgi:hypothetical protein